MCLLGVSWPFVQLTKVCLSAQEKNSAGFFRRLLDHFLCFGGWFDRCSILNRRGLGRSFSFYLNVKRRKRLRWRLLERLRERHRGQLIHSGWGHLLHEQRGECPRLSFDSMKESGS